MRIRNTGCTRWLRFDKSKLLPIQNGPCFFHHHQPWQLEQVKKGFTVLYLFQNLAKIPDPFPNSMFLYPQIQPPTLKLRMGHTVNRYVVKYLYGLNK